MIDIPRNPGEAAAYANGRADQWESDAKVIAALREALRQLVERIDINGGIGEYKGGPAFVMANARAALAATNEQTVGESK